MTVTSAPPEPPRQTRSTGSIIAIVLTITVCALVVLFVANAVLSGARAVSASRYAPPDTVYTPPAVAEPSYSYTPPSESAAALPPPPGAFGTVLPLDQGITVGTGKLRNYRASSSAAGEEGAERLVLVPITFTNNTNRYVTFADKYFTNMTIDGATAQSVIDMGNEAAGVENVGGLITTPTPPGKSLTIGLVWALQNGPATLGLKITSNDYSGTAATPEWAGAIS